MKKRITILAVAGFLTISAMAHGADPPASAPETQPQIAIRQDIGDAMIREASRVKEEIKLQARSLFERKPLDWDLGTIRYLYDWLLSAPLRIPELTRHILEQSRILGVIGSLIVLAFIVAVLYSWRGRSRMLKRIETLIRPHEEKVPAALFPYILSMVKVIVETLIPLTLLGFFSLIDALIAYRAGWFQFTGRVLILWTIGALINRLLREALTKGLFPAAAAHGETLYRLTRPTLLFVLIGIGGFWAAESFGIRNDVLALLRFAVSVSIVIVLALPLLNKKAQLSLVPKLPYRGYQGFVHFLDRLYYPLIALSFLAALLWCAGYHQLGRSILFKIWFSAAAFVGIMLAYHGCQIWLQRWSRKADTSDESVGLLIRSFHALLLYAAVTVTLVIVLNLMGLLTPLQRLMSFPIFSLGEAPVTLWTLVSAAFILLAFFYASRLLQAYFDYKVYPTLGVDPGLGYALNTFLKYASFVIGFLISLRIVGIDLRFLLVFAGAIGIGIGLGLQNMAANVISGFSIIFGGKLRKGDWIEAGNTLGMITDIYLRATKVRTRDNIEYLIPNSNLISNTIVNYSLSSPMVRIEVPVGVSYNADPREVERILLAVAEKEPMVEKYETPVVRFVTYGDNSINFELLVWMDVRKTPRKKIRSNLYFAIFEELKKAGIEIPFPQRDIHIRSTVS